MKRKAEGTHWEVGERTAAMVCEVLEEAKKDPVRKRWRVPKTIEGILWCDASSITTGIMIEIDGQVVEDAAWLKKRTDFSYNCDDTTSAPRIHQLL